MYLNLKTQYANEILVLLITRLLTECGLSVHSISLDPRCRHERLPLSLVGHKCIGYILDFL